MDMLLHLAVTLAVELAIALIGRYVLSRLDSKTAVAPA
jgi:hypothetical protein